MKIRINIMRSKKKIFTQLLHSELDIVTIIVQINRTL